MYYCTQCGKQVADTSKFCMHCGAALTPPPTAAPGPATVSQPAAPKRVPEEKVRTTPRAQRWRRTLVTTGIVAGVLVLVIGLALLAVRQWLHLGTNHTAKMMPEETGLYVVFNPGVRQLIQFSNAERLQVLGTPLALAVGSSDLGELAGDLDISGLDFQEDLMPWIGLEIGAGIIDLGNSEIGFALAVTTRNRKASDGFLEKVWDQMEAGGSSFDETEYSGIPIIFEVVRSEEKVAFATFERFVVVADTLETMQKIIDTSQGRSPSLRRNTTYQEVMGRLPGNRAGAIYVPVDLTKEMTLGIDMGLLEAYRGLGMAFSLERDTIRMDLLRLLDTREMDQKELDHFQRDAHRPRIPEMLPEDALFVLTGEDLLAGWEAILGGPLGFLAEVDYIVEGIRDETGIDLREDVLGLMTGEYALVALSDQDDPLDLDMPLAPLLVAEVPDGDRMQIERSVADLFEELAYEFDEENIYNWSGVDVHMVEDTWSDFALGYGFSEDPFFLGLSRTALRSGVRASEAPLAQGANFRKYMKPLPDKNRGIFYADVAALLRLIERSMSDYEREQFEEEAKPYLEPLLALSGTSLPGDGKGFQQSIIYLHFAEQ